MGPARFTCSGDCPDRGAGQVNMAADRQFGDRAGAVLGYWPKGAFVPCRFCTVEHCRTGIERGEVCERFVLLEQAFGIDFDDDGRFR